MASRPVNLAYGGGAAKNKTSPPPEAGLTAPPLWIGDPANFCATATDKNIDVVFKRLTAGKKPAAAGVLPHIVMTIGPPGAGKSTLARQFLSHWSDMKEGNYVELDADSILDYLPAGEQLRNLPDMLGRPTGVGAAYGWDDCIGHVEGITTALFYRLMEERYYIIYHSHYYMHLIETNYAGYVSTLLYVAVSRETALRRAAARAKETGRFLRPALENNGWGWENTVTRMWHTYRSWAPWYALWADNLGVVNNDRDGHEFAKEDFKSFLTHPPEPSGENWTQYVSGLWHAIGDAHGPEVAKK